MPSQPAASELLRALAPVLARWGRWYVFGAQAVIIYGVPRLSADVDVTLALAPDAPERFAAEMQAAGFALRVDDPEFVRRTRVMPFTHLPTLLPLDIVLAGSGLEDEFLDRAVPTDIGGTVVPLIDLGDLIIAKVLAGRPKDVDERAVAPPRSESRRGSHSAHPAPARGGLEPGRSGVELRDDRTPDPSGMSVGRNAQETGVRCASGVR